MSRTKRYTCKQVIDAIRLAKGMVYLAAENLNCSPQTVYNYIARYPEIEEVWDLENTKVRAIAENKLFDAIVRGEHWAIAFYLSTKAGYTGSGYGFTGGDYPPEFNRNLKQWVKERDGFVCAICGKPGIDRSLSVHHVDYNKQNSSDENLVALCASCHAKTNGNREYWQSWLTSIRQSGASEVDTPDPQHNDQQLSFW